MDVVAINLNPAVGVMFNRLASMVFNLELTRKPG